MNRKHLISLFSIILCVLLVIAGCSAKAPYGAMDSTSQNTTNQKPADGGRGEAESAGSAPAYTKGGAVTADKNMGIAPVPPIPTPTGGLSPQNQKLIYQLNYSIETLEFDKSVSAVSELAKKLGGFIENTNVGGGPGILVKEGIESGRYKEPRYGNFTLRIPAAKLSEFESGAGELGNVTNFSKTSQDITLQYTDNEARLNSLKVQEERLLDMLKKSGSLGDLIQIENALSNVRYQIESFTSTQRQYDSQVTYSYVTIALAEVIEYTEQVATPKTLWQRISLKFMSSVKAIVNTAESFVVWLFGNILIIIIDLAVLAAAIFFGRKAYKKYKVRRETKSE